MINATHNTQFIQRKLGMSPLEYCELVERGGYAWLDKYFFCAPEVIQASSYSTLFWKWWVNEWNIRDEAFVKHVRFCNPEVEQLDYYFSVHSIQKLVIHPNKFARKEINALIKQIILTSL